MAGTQKTCLTCPIVLLNESLEILGIERIFEKDLGIVLEEVESYLLDVLFSQIVEEL